MADQAFKARSASGFEPLPTAARTLARGPGNMPDNLVSMLNAGPRAAQLHAMGALINGVASANGVVQRVHPAFNGVNYWRLPITNIETGEQEPHPHSPEGKFNGLAKEFGAEVAKEILYTDLDENEAVERENMTRQFYQAGGSPWDALKLLKAYPDDNRKLDEAYRFFITSRTGYKPKSKIGRNDPEVLKSIKSLEKYRERELHEQRDLYESILRQAPQNAAHFEPKLLAIDIMLERRLADRRGPLTLLTKGSSGSGMEVWVFGAAQLREREKSFEWISKVLQAVLNAKVLNEHQPALKIKIEIHNRVGSDIAVTNATGVFITVAIEEYQVSFFSVGEMVGLLAHEIGVHTFADARLTETQKTAERDDAGSLVQGEHGGRRYDVGARKDLRGQQADHLTIGRAILGQPSGIGRLRSYETTMISLIEAQSHNKEAQRETAAAYCLDVARILVTNDSRPRTFWEGTSIAPAIVHAAVAEWQRILGRYAGQHPTLAQLKIDGTYIWSCLPKLGLLAFKVSGKQSYIK